MKIALYHNLLPGGAKRVVYEQVREIAKNHEIHLFELSSTPEIFLNVRPLVKRVIRYKFNLASSLPASLARLQKDYQNLIKLDSLHKRIAHDINNGGFDVALIHPDRFIQAPFLLKYLTIPSAYFCEELLRIAYEKELAFNENVVFIKKWYEQATRLIRKNIDRNNARHATKILVSSKYIQSQVKNAYAKNSSVCNLGVDSKIFTPSGVKKTNTILFVGEKSIMHDYNLAKQAADLVPASLKSKFKVIDFSSSNQPRLSDKELAQEYSKARVTLCMSRGEPFGLIALESMACGTPVIAANECGYKETIVDNKTGFLLPRKPNEFAKKISYLLKNSRVAKNMGKNGREHVKRNFTWKKHAQKIEDHLAGMQAKMPS